MNNLKYGIDNIQKVIKGMDKKMSFNLRLIGGMIGDHKVSESPNHEDSNDQN